MRDLRAAYEWRRRYRLASLLLLLITSESDPAERLDPTHERRLLASHYFIVDRLDIESYAKHYRHRTDSGATHFRRSRR